MYRFIVSMFAILLSFSMVIQNADAARFGARRFYVPHTKPQFSVFHQKQAAAVSNPSKWRHILSGFVLGSVLSSLMMGHGFGSGLFAWLLLGAMIWFIRQIVQQKKHARKYDNSRDRSQ